MKKVNVCSGGFSSFCWTCNELNYSNNTYSYIFCLLKFAPAFVLFNRVGIIISTMLEMAIVVNIGLGIFNLVPLPPLDGSKILMHFLPYNARNWFVSNQNIFYIVFLVIWITGAVGYIISPIINAVYIGLYSAIGWIFGLF